MDGRLIEVRLYLHALKVTTLGFVSKDIDRFRRFFFFIIIINGLGYTPSQKIELWCVYKIRHYIYLHI